MEPSKPQAPAPKPQEVVIQLDWSDEPIPAYANGAQILNSQREFAIVFTDFVTFAGRGGAPLNAAPKAKIVANVRLTPDVFFQLAAACASNWNQFVKHFGEPDSPRFHVVDGAGTKLEDLVDE